MIAELVAMADTGTKKNRLGTLESLYDASTGTELPLPQELAHFYGALRFPLNEGEPYVIANLVTSLDGVVSLGIPGKAGGKEISGSNEQDRAVMGVLRAVADAVVVGAGTLREGHGDPLTAQAIYPPFAGAYSALRTNLNRKDQPLAVIVTASGDLDPTLPILKSEPVLIVTTAKGARHADKLGLPDAVQVVEVPTEGDGSGKEGSIPASAVLDAIKKVLECEIVLVEGGPHLLGDFLAAELINEQFLTLSPQVVGRNDSTERLALVEGKAFAPEHPLWSTLVAAKRSTKQSESLLFLRYKFDRAK